MRLQKSQTIEELSFELAESSVEFMKRKSKLVHDMARLAKYWNQGTLFKDYISGRSMIFELLGTKAAMEEEQKHDNPSLSRAFKNFLTMVRNIRHLSITFNDYFDQSQIPSELMQQRPYLIDPVNPYNNMLDVKGKSNMVKFFSVFEEAAVYVLGMIENGCNDIDTIFYPTSSLYTLRKKENWFFPKENTCLISIESSNEEWIQKITSRF